MSHDHPVDRALDSDRKIDFRERHLQPEWMDQPGLDADLHHSALRGLQLVNALSLIHRTFWPAVRQLAKRLRKSELRVLDVACGGGDVAVRLVQAAQRHGLKLLISGCDISPTAIGFAKERAEKAGIPIEFFLFNVLQDDWPDGYDVVVNSLFLHHLATGAAVQVLGHLAASTNHLLLINDLVRSREGHLLARFAAPLLSRSPIVHSDGPISVEAAFTVSELEAMALRAGLNGAKVSHCWPARMLLQWNKS